MKHWSVLAVLIALASTAHATVSESPNPLDVGAVVVGDSGNASGTLTDTGVDVVDLDFTCPEFDIQPNSVIAVSAATPVAIDATLTPTSRGAKTCHVSIVDHVGGTTLATFDVTGTADAPVISVPASVDFGSVRVTTGATSTNTVAITNSGDADLNITALALTGDYALQTPPTFPIVVTAGNSTNVGVVFDPTAPGTRAGTLSITSDALGSPVTNVPLTGVGTNATISVTTPVDFAVVTDGTTVSKAITITNGGAAPKGPLHVSTATLADASGFFAFDPADGCAGNPCTINADVTTTLAFKVTCSPGATATGTATATVTFASDADNANNNVTTLTCTAGRPVLGVSPTSIDYASVLVGQQSTVTVTISNAGGTKALTYSLATVGGQAGQFTLGNGCVSGCSIAVGGPDQTVDVTYTPPALGPSATTLRITNNSPGDNPFDIPLTGTGIAPKIAAPANVAFGNLEVGTSTTKTLTITNTGTADLHITTATLSAAAVDFAVTTGNTGAQTVAPNGSAVWTIQCTPSAFGPRPGNFQIASDAFNTPNATVGLACTGLAGQLALSSPTMAFGGVRIGDTVTQNVTLKNIGNAAVTLTSQTLSSTTVGYSFTTTLPATLAPSGTTVVTVQFAPQTATDGGNVSATFAGTSGSTVITPTTAVLAITGSALTADYSTSTAALDLGDVRWDHTATATFQIIQTDDPKITIETLDVAPDGASGTITGELAVTAIKHNGTPVTLPFQLQAANDKLDITITADPANRTGPLKADLTVHSDLGSNPDRHVTLTATSTSPELQLTPGATFDFGGVDVHGPAVQQTFTIKNTGDGPLDLGTVTTSGSGKYTFTLPVAATLQPNDTRDIDVTYTPTLEAADTTTITVPLTGIFGDSPDSQTIVVSGHGTDRHIQVPTDVTFPDTFVFPDTPTTMSVAVHNGGEATLHISMLAASTQWAVMAGTADVAGNATLQVDVQFSPTMVGTDDGTLTISNNDTGAPMAIVNLRGKGIDRNVAVTPSTIDMGTAGLGVALHLTDLSADGFQIINMDAVDGFTIHDATLTADPAFPPNPSDGAFTFNTPPANTTLPPSATRQFDIVFQTDTEGTYHVLANVFLDNDPAPRSVPITARAVFVDVHGGGGCDAGGGAGMAMILVVGLLLRKRVVLLLAGGVASADTRNVDVSVFDPTPQTTATTLQVQTPSVGPDGTWIASAVLSYARDPLVLNDTAPIANRMQYVIGGAYAFLGRFEAGLRVPLLTQSGDAATIEDPNARPASGTSLGDLELHGKANIWAQNKATIGAGVSLTLPTASDGEFAGANGPEGHVLALGAYQVLPQLTVLLDFGAVLRGHSHLENIDQKSGVAWGVGATYRFADELWAAAEMYGEAIPSGRTTKMGTSVLATSELLASVHMQVADHTALGLAIGTGMQAGLGAPSVRGVVQLTYTPASAAAPIHPPIPMPPDVDTDGDGIPDRLDKCPNEPEDKDMYEDADGCPDPDNDGDGIPDTKDKCPLDPEDKDGFQDEDGCPDRDNDGDGIPDDRDKCPNEPEDKDGFQDLDGCPDPDNDNDGIPDEKDKCPNSPETINGVQDEDGCPDSGDSSVMLGADRIDLLAPVLFNGTKIAKTSLNVLGQIGATLRAHREIARVRIGVHVQPTKNSDKDLDQSTKRAEAVRDWLVNYGIDTKRLDVKGYGSTKPLDPKGSAAINDRVEFIIMERQSLPP